MGPDMADLREPGPAYEQGEYPGRQRQSCKVFVGGLNWETDDERLKRYFENYGTVTEAFISLNRTTGTSRGFGFVTFEDPAVAERVVTSKHTIDRRNVRTLCYARF
jgi:RNA recognition motif-containing protein